MCTNTVAARFYKMSAPRLTVFCVRAGLIHTSIRHAFSTNIVEHCQIASNDKPIVSSDVKLVDDIERDFNEKRTTARKHPGIVRLKYVNMPPRLQNALEILLKQYPTKDVAVNSVKLARHLWARKIPIEDSEIRAQAKVLYHQFQTEGENLKTEAEIEKFEKTVRQKVVQQLKRQNYHWHAMEYTAYQSYLYMVARLPAEYAVVSQCLNEIRLRHADYKPQSLYDFGSGVGSVIWASHQIWKQSLQQIYCVDPSNDMNVLARLLLQDGDENGKMSISGVHFRQSSPSSKNKYEVTVSAYTLLELPSQKDRYTLLDDLWEKTIHYMVLIDNCTIAGFNIIMEARDYILKQSHERGDPAFIFAPCPHSFTCPLLQKGRHLCGNEVTYKPLTVFSTNKRTERYSYVILSKLKPSVRWPRVVQPVLKPSRHTHVHICDTDGQLKHVVITKSKHSPNLYSASRYTNIGDQFPIVLPHEPSHSEQKTDDTTNDTSDKQEKTTVDDTWTLNDTPTKINLTNHDHNMVQCTGNQNNI